MRPYLPIVAILVSFWPVWFWYISRMTDGSDEPYGVIALCLAGYFIWRDRDLIKTGNQMSVTALIFLGVYILAFPFLPPLLRAVLAIFILGLVTGSLLKMPAVWGLVALSLPVIASLQFYIGYPMRLIAASTTEWTLKLFQLPVTRSGTDLYRGESLVGVDPACSGVEMLWVGMLLIFTQAAWSRWKMGHFILATGLGLVGVIIGNSFRVTLLFFKESGMIDLPSWTHEGVGLLIFFFLILAFAKYFPGEEKRSPVSFNSKSTTQRQHILSALLLFASIVPAFSQRGTIDSQDSLDFAWPQEFRGEKLEKLSLSPSEMTFAGQFPGKLGVFRSGTDKIIIRYVEKPTRKLHPSAHCLKAAGYEIESDRPGQCIAFSSAGEYGLIVEEAIFDSDQLSGKPRWQEVGKWFWQVSLQNETGPWWAVTKIRRFE